MIDLTYDPDADAAYIRLGLGQVDRTEEAGPFLYDLDENGRVLGIEIVGCRQVLAPGDWANARPPSGRVAEAAE